MAVPALTPAQIQALSVDQLIELLPASDEERYLPRVSPDDEKLFKQDPERFIKPDTKAVLEELWNRLFPAMESKVKAKLQAICPRQHGDREDFAREAINDAYLAFLRRIKNRDAQGRKHENFPGYVYTLFLNIGRDKRRGITGRAQPDEDQKEKPAVPLEGDIAPKKSVPQEKKYAAPRKPILRPIEEGLTVSHGKGPLQELAEGQLKAIIRGILEDHAGDNPMSTKTLVLHGAEGQTWEEVAEEVFPAQFFAKSLEARKGQVRRLFKEDRDIVAPKFEKYGITSEHIFHWKETSGAGTAESESE
ncbi:MAG: hypothetical protein ACHP7P_06645 [Terriglobales bacterium]